MTGWNFSNHYNMIVNASVASEVVYSRQLSVGSNVAGNLTVFRGIDAGGYGIETGIFADHSSKTAYVTYRGTQGFKDNLVNGWSIAGMSSLFPAPFGFDPDAGYHSEIVRMGANAVSSVPANYTTVITGHSKGGYEANVFAEYLHRTGRTTPTVTFLAPGPSHVSSPSHPLVNKFINANTGYNYVIKGGRPIQTGRKVTGITLSDVFQFNLPMSVNLIDLKYNTPNSVADTGAEISGQVMVLPIDSGHAQLKMRDYLLDFRKQQSLTNGFNGLDYLAEQNRSRYGSSNDGYDNSSFRGYGDMHRNFHTCASYKSNPNVTETQSYDTVAVTVIHICDGDTYVTVESMYILKQYRKSLVGGKAAKILIEGIQLFAKNNDARGIFVYGTMGAEDEALAKLMQKSGFELLGRNWLG